MPRELERRVVELVHSIYGGQLGSTPEWLIRPGPAECGQHWSLVQRIYRELTGGELPEVMPARERRHLDAVLVKRGRPPRILEVDETQHFNEFRATTLRAYPKRLALGYPKKVWLQRSEAKKRLEGGGFAKPRPPLFPGPGGRHRQRAFRDALADIVPLVHGWLPTLRVADFEVAAWIYAPDAKRRMKALLDDRI